MRANIQGPKEGCTWRGYYSLELYNDQDELVLDANVAEGQDALLDDVVAATIGEMGEPDGILESLFG